MTRSHPFNVPCVVGALLASILSSTPAAAVERQTTDPATCLDAIDRTERRLTLPPGLLLSVALAESGRREGATGLLVPWAWTLNVAGRGRVFETADAAVADGAAALARNDALVDVGCMQIDLYHHPKAFRTLRAAFDPETNVDYAAHTLLVLHRSYRSWTAAVAAYHAGTARRADGATYLSRVLYFWKALKPQVRVAEAAPPGRRGFSVEAVPQPLDLAADFYVKRDYEAALALYRVTLATHPNDPIALQGVAECLVHSGRPEAAQALLLRALSVGPHDGPALDALLRAIDRLPQGTRLAHLIAARSVAPDASAIAARIALIEADDGDLDHALADMAAAIRLAPDDPMLQLDDALMLDRHGDRVAARQAYLDFLTRYRPGNHVLSVPLETIRQRYAYLVDSQR